MTLTIQDLGALGELRGSVAVPRASMAVVLSPRSLVLLAALALLAGMACATPIRGYHEQDPDADFTKFTNFVWIAQGPLFQTEPGVASQELPIGPVMENHLRRAVERELIAKGYPRREEAGADSLVVSFSVSERQEIQVESYPGHGGYVYPHHAESWPATTDVRTYTRGTLALTFFDGGSKLAIWHGWASKHVYENTDQETREATIDEAVAAILADLPPRVAGE